MFPSLFAVHALLGCRDKGNESVFEVCDALILMHCQGGIRGCRMVPGEYKARC